MRTGSDDELWVIVISKLKQWNAKSYTIDFKCIKMKVLNDTEVNFLIYIYSLNTY